MWSFDISMFILQHCRLKIKFIFFHTRIQSRSPNDHFRLRRISCSGDCSSFRERETLNRWEIEEEIPIFHLKLIFVPPEKTKDNELLRDRISFQFISSQVNRHNPQFEHICLGWTKQSPLNSPNWCRWRRSFEEIDVHIRWLSRMRCVSWIFLAKNHLLFQIERRTRINDDDWLSKWRSRFVFFNDQWELIHSTISMITRSPNKQILDLIVCDSFPKVC